MKRLQIIALSTSIFALTGFGLKEWGINVPKLYAQLYTQCYQKTHQTEITTAAANAQAQRNAIQKQEWEKAHELWKEGHPGAPSWDWNGHPDSNSLAHTKKRTDASLEDMAN